MTTKVKTASEIEAMRQSGRILATVLQYLRPKVKPGVTTAELARFAREIIRQGGEPAFLGYEGFPDVICISVNDEIVHGIPSEDQCYQRRGFGELGHGSYLQGHDN
jgi:methionyl aminopeptidase